ncbi:MAG: CDP-diacylglycerol--serine O-phosphatidyltransferase [Bacteroidetes bacterium]|nr:CDP-diacylglycerol--serine O-phosphatidyltransferase [Bacteroidota bacterium]
MKFIKNWIPNILTLANLACGMIACWVAAFNIPDFLQNQNSISSKWLLVSPSLFIFASSVFDFLDGFAARILKINTELGKQLDSLADVVSFGVAPSFIIIAYSFMGDYSIFGLFIGLFSAIRLAKFNIDSRQTDSFLGLPVPSSGLIVASLPFVEKNGMLSFMINPWFVTFLIFILCMLMVSEIPLLALKFKNFAIKENLYRWIVILIGAVSLISFGFQGISIAILGYVLVSVIALKFKIE